MTFPACKTSKYIVSYSLRQMRLHCITRRQYCLLNLSLMHEKTLVAVLSSSRRQRLLVVTQRKTGLPRWSNKSRFQIKQRHVTIRPCVIEIHLFKEIEKISTRNTSPPPFLKQRYGNRQMFSRPME